MQFLKQNQFKRKKKHWKTILACQAKHFTSREANSTWEVLRGRLGHA